MERIASFTVNHDVLTPGLYLSSRDGSVTTFDQRFKKPNTGDLLTNAQMHSVEHIIATALRNSPQKDAVIYFGPMGCQTGFYFLFDSQRLTDAQAIDLLQAGVRPRCGVERRHARQVLPRVRQLQQSGRGAGPGMLRLLRRHHRQLDGGKAGLSGIKEKLRKFTGKIPNFLLTTAFPAVILIRPL